MKREFLQEKGLDKETIDAIMEANGADINAAKQEVATLQGQLNTANETIKNLREAAGKYNGAELEKQLNELQQKYTADTKALQDALDSEKLAGALEAAMVRGGARNTKALMGLLDLEKISMKDGNLTGLEDQLKAIRETDAYLFNDGPRGSWGGRHDGGAPMAKGGVESAFEKLNPNLKID